MDPLTVAPLKSLLIIVLVGFLPLSAFTYYTVRHKQRRLEVARILEKLQITSRYADIYRRDFGPLHFVLAVAFACAVSLAGLAALLLASELEIAHTPSLPLQGANLPPANGLIDETLLKYQQGALLVYGMAFLGAYLWGLQNIFRRYAMNDLIPGAYYRLGVRMIFASVIALLMYHATDALTEGAPIDALTKGAPIDVRGSMLPVVAFFIGMFPEPAIRWLRRRMPFMGNEKHPSVRPLPLEMIEGMTVHDRYRLEELGIDTCYDLAAADYIPLLLKTPYGARELVDWLLQAKLCVRFGPEVKVLREHGFRTITDLERLDDKLREELVRDTPLTESSLEQAKEAKQFDYNIERLQRAAQLLGEYWEGYEEEESKK